MVSTSMAPPGPPNVSQPARQLTAYVTAYAGHSVSRQDTLWHERVRPPNTGSTSWDVLTLHGTEGQSPLNPKVQGSTPCASTIMLCPTASGRASRVPDVPSDGDGLPPLRC